MPGVWEGRKVVSTGHDAVFFRCDVCSGLLKFLIEGRDGKRRCVRCDAAYRAGGGR